MGLIILSIEQKAFSQNSQDEKIIMKLYSEQLLHPKCKLRTYFYIIMYLSKNTLFYFVFWLIYEIKNESLNVFPRDI